MKITVAREPLKEALAWTQNLIEKKTPKAILSNALFELNPEGLTITATDLKVGVQVHVPLSSNEEARFAVPAKHLHDILREIPNEKVELDWKKGAWLHIKSGRSQFKVATLSAEEFPSMPDLPKEKDFFSVDAPLLKDMIAKTLFAASTDVSKFNLNGVLLESLGGSTLRMVATDGHRLSLSDKKLSQEVNLEKSVLLPRKGVIELQKLITEEDATLPMALVGRNVVVERGEVRLFIRLVEGDFPNYQQVLPKNQSLKLKLNKDDFLSAIKRVSLLSQDHHPGIKFKISSGFLQLSCSNPDLGEAEEDIECDYKGEALEIGFNYRYFLDILNVLEDEILSLELKDQVSPCLIRSEIDKGFQTLIMPMRL
ncbi:MAG: DNA polymerase III subunit beta [Deltaproteobacteria bacterium]|nr:DNA polymerase III subunit beta [Deltaproteobacteria bacterium]